jgi:hypothetical protein
MANRKNRENIPEGCEGLPLDTNPPSDKPVNDNSEAYSRTEQRSLLGIAVREVDGTYLIDMGDWSLTTVPTIRQAQVIFHKIAWTFKGSLPVGN